MATYQSLYRRYRPQRFDEVLGQDHVTRALRNAVRDGRVGHAYLFSGPRGTGKTSTARILAKVLNCAAPADGEPCGVCENCVAVAEGRVTDWLLEQDAASKSKVDDMRDLLERVPLGTSGNRKVIILDEVHMLSQGAENALLKTLEEPPAHVVFVLATTDPQKVRPTIRSRTQHFEFRLLPPDVLADHIRYVIDHAGLGLDAGAVDEAVEHVLRSGGGSARDTLSALDQVAALGEVVDERHPVDAVLDALCDHDAGRVLVAVADALAAGREPRALGEALIAALRDAFLSLMGAADDHLPPASRERAAQVGERLGAPGLTRALDVLGEALTELSRKPDPRIVVEVALVRLTQPAADRTLDAVLERLDRIERAMASGALPAAAGDRPPPAPASGAPAAAGAGSAGAGAAGAAPGADPAGSSPPPHPASVAPTATAAGGGGRGRSGAAAARDALSTARRPETDAEQAAPPAGAPRAERPTLGAVTRGRRGGRQARSGDASATGAVGGRAGATAPGVAGAADAAGEGGAPAPGAAGAANAADGGETATASGAGGGAAGAPGAAGAGGGAAGAPGAAGAGGGAAGAPGAAGAGGGAAGGAADATVARASDVAGARGTAGTTSTAGGSGGAAGAPGAAGASGGAPGAPGPAGAANVAGASGAVGADGTGGAAGASGGAAGAPGEAPATPPGGGVATADLPSLAEVDAAWSGGVLAGLPVKIRSKWRGGRWAAPADGALRFAVPNAWHQTACDEARREVEQALAAHFGRRVAVAVVVDGDAGGGDPLGVPPPGPPGGAPAERGGGADARVGAGDDHDEHIDVSELRDADDAPSGGVDMLLQEFGGGQVIEEDR